MKVTLFRFKLTKKVNMVDKPAISSSLVLIGIKTPTGTHGLKGLTTLKI